MRPNWHEYFMKFAELAAERATCIRRQVGAALVKNNRVLATGYNGAPQGLLHCDVAGCIREHTSVPSGQRQELCRGLHAEQNAIIQAARLGVAVDGATLYCTTQPCSICTKMLINVGIKEIHYRDGYSDTLARLLLEQSGIPIHQKN